MKLAGDVDLKMEEATTKEHNSQEMPGLTCTSFLDLF
jgi:hypothetical protein